MNQCTGYISKPHVTNDRLRHVTYEGITYHLCLQCYYKLRNNAIPLDD